MRAAVSILALGALAGIVWWLLAGGVAEPPPEPGATLRPGSPDAPESPVLEGRGPQPNVASPPVQDAPVSANTAAETPVVAAGIVVGEDQQPVAGAEIAAWIQGVQTGTARSAADGSFDVALLPRDAEHRFGRMELRHGHSGATRIVYVSPWSEDRLDFGRIALAGMHGVTVRVMRGGAPVAGARVMVGQAALMRGEAPFPMLSTGADGLARFAGVLGPKVGAYAVAEGTGRAYRELHLPADGIVDLELPDERTGVIRVKHGVTGAPVAGAEVFLGGGGTLPPPGGPGCLPPYPDLRTGSDGSLTVAGLPQGYVWVVARGEGLAMRNNGLMVERVMLQPDASEAEVTLWPYRAVRFPITESGAGAPAEGTVLTVRRYQPLSGYDVREPEARIEDGQLVLEPFPPGFDTGHVATDDRRWARWTTPLDKDVGEAVTFQHVYDLRVRLLWRDGSPAAGELLGVHLSPRGRMDPARTDAHGEAVFPRCLAESATVSWTPREKGFGMPLGSANLVTDPGLRIFTIDRPIDIVLRVLEGGRPRLPPGLRVSVPDLDPDSALGGDRDLYGETQQDAAAGEVRLRWLPLPDGTAPPVTLEAEGMPAVTVVPKKGEDGVWRADAQLVAGGTLRARVLPPEGGRYWIQLEQERPDGQGWIFLHDHPGYQAGRRGVEGVHTMPGLSPGRYRLVEGYTNLASEPFEVVGGAEVELEFDLGAIVVVQGRVVVPDGENPAYASFGVEGRTAGQTSTRNPGRVKADGSFEFRARRGERIGLVVQHPFLRPLQAATYFVAGKEEPVLRLGPGPYLMFRLEGSDLSTADPSPSMLPSWHSPVHVRVCAPGAWDPEAPPRPAMAVHGLCRVGAPAPGTWTLRIEQHGFVPILLEDVKVGDGATDLGTVRFSEGATLTVRLGLGEGGLPQALNVEVQREGERPYSTWGSEVQPGEPLTVVVKGLGAGRFKVLVRKTWARGDPIGEAVVESDGHTPLSVHVKLR